MKVYVASHIHQLAPEVITALENIGVEYTSSINESGITTTFIRMEVDNNLDVLAAANPTLMSVYGGDVNQFVRGNNGLPSHDLNSKSALYAKLAELNLPVIPSLRPNSLADVEAFFDTNGAFYCKPLLGEGGGVPINGYPIKHHLYRSYTSYEDFVAVLNEYEYDFNDLQTTNTVPLSDKCVIQKLIDTTGFKNSRVFGCVNGSNQFAFYPILIGHNPLFATESAGPTSRSWNGISWGNGLPSDAELLAGARDPSKVNTDQHNMLATIETLFTAANIKNTFFHVEFFINEDTEEFYIQDVALKIANAHYRSQPTDVFEDQLKFVLDMQPTVTKYNPNWVMLAHLPCKEPTGWTPSIVANLKTHNIKPFNARLGQTFGMFTIEAATQAEVVAKCKAYFNNTL